MPLISTFGSAGSQAFGNRGLQVDGSALFNATADRLTFSSSVAFSYGTGDFTIEGWFYPTSFGSFRVIWRQNASVYLYLNSTGAVQWFPGSGTGVITTNSMTLNAWNHVAVVKNAGSTRIFLNGVGYASVANPTSIPTPTFSPILGCYDAAGQLQYLGYITNFRICKQALYTANFIPSLIPFTRTSQNSTTTNLLLKMASASTLNVDSSFNNLSFSNVNVSFSTFAPYLQPYVTPPNIIVSSATVTPDTVTPSEGTTITVNVVGTNTANGTYYYSLQEEIGTGALTGADFNSGSLTGSFTITGGTGSFPITVTRDLLTEGNERFTIYVRTTSTSGQIIGTSAEITITDTSITPTLTPSAASVNEGSAVTFTATNVGPGGTYFWTVSGISAGDVTATSGSFLVSNGTGGVDNGTGTFTITTVADRTTEGTETMNVQVRSGSTSGTIVANSSVTITDISLTPSTTFLNSTNIAELTSGFATSTTLRVSNLGPAGTYYYTINSTFGSVTAADISGGLSGSFTTSTLNGSADIVITAAADTVVEPNAGVQTCQVQIREGSITGTILATSGTITIFNSSVSVAVAPNPASEGNGLNITVTTDLSGNGSVASGTYWLTFVAGTATAADVSGLPTAFGISSPGVYGVNGVVSITSLDGAEGSETFQIACRYGSITGPIVGLSPVITINASVT